MQPNSADVFPHRAYLTFAHLSYRGLPNRQPSYAVVTLNPFSGRFVGAAGRKVKPGFAKVVDPALTFH